MQQKANPLPAAWLPSPVVVIVVVVLAAAFDLGTKAIAEHGLADQSILGVLPVLDLQLAFNDGISFGLFPAHTSLSVAMLLALQSVLTALAPGWSLGSAELWQRFGLAAIAGGAAGNLVDRLDDGAVTDFLDLHTAGVHWFTFNLADVWISVGASLMILRELRAMHRPGDQLGML